ncbi:MAG: hypothetical protein KME32_15670 [Mojavia pulchra JT2-VF2]|uniref:Uncharacterized protein n=1 Tax=Mojavia pulchra JT2-VF2 TaxID=287848 RepID=A0A951PZ01_9NOST|nr:hypothetical protein [Mojavia pulchra JT2-VF2]
MAISRLFARFPKGKSHIRLLKLIITNEILRAVSISKSGRVAIAQLRKIWAKFMSSLSRFAFSSGCITLASPSLFAVALSTCDKNSSWGSDIGVVFASVLLLDGDNPSF